MPKVQARSPSVRNHTGRQRDRSLVTAAELSPGDARQMEGTGASESTGAWTRRLTLPRTPQSNPTVSRWSPKSAFTQRPSLLYLPTMGPLIKPGGVQWRMKWLIPSSICPSKCLGRKVLSSNSCVQGTYHVINGQVAGVTCHGSTILWKFNPMARQKDFKKRPLARGWNRGLHCELFAKIIP